jgi:hypothetical protein
VCSKCPPACFDTRTETRTPLPDYVVNDALIESLPLLRDTVALLFDIPVPPVDSFLHHSPDFVVHWVHIRAVGRPESRLNLVRSLTELLLTVCVVIDASFFRLNVQAGFLSYAVYDLNGLLQ